MYQYLDFVHKTFKQKMTKSMSIHSSVLQVMRKVDEAVEMLIVISFLIFSSSSWRRFGSAP